MIMSRKPVIFGIALIFLLLNLIYFTETIPKPANVYQKVRLSLANSNWLGSTATPGHNGSMQEEAEIVPYHPKHVVRPLSTIEHVAAEEGDDVVIEAEVREKELENTEAKAKAAVMAAKETESNHDVKSSTSNDDPSKPQPPITNKNTKQPSKQNHLTSLCAATRWTPGLWLHCHSGCGANKTSICGGLNNARNRLQTCLRLAIDSGAGIILPSATTRNEKKLVDVQGDTVCTEVFWDVDLLRKELGEQCKGLGVRGCDDRSGIDEERVLDLPVRKYTDIAHFKSSFLSLVSKNIASFTPFRETPISMQNPGIVSFRDSYIGWDYQRSGELSTIRRDLFSVLSFNRKLLDLSKEILGSRELMGGAFIGVHLRGEDDWPKGFGTVKDQMRLYIEDIERVSASRSSSSSSSLDDDDDGTEQQQNKEIKTIYVSCGSQDAIQVFREKLEVLGYTVHDKWTLLSGKGKEGLLKEVEGLHFDQKAIVEYQTLVGAKYWLGIISSTMSCLIAYARTVNGEGLGALEVASGGKGDSDEDDDRNGEGEFFDKYIFPGSKRLPGGKRAYPNGMEVRGSEKTRLIVLTGRDIMRTFP